MSLKFGIYLVEQRIVSPEQFCGLVKIQQEALASLATIAIRKNMLTIKQVASILDIQEVAPTKSFTSIAVDRDFFDPADAQQLLHEQQSACLSMRQLVVECGLLTDRQVVVLFQHFEKIGTRKAPDVKSTTGMQESVPAPSSRMPTANSESGSSTAQPIPVSNRAPIRQPKFRQRPVIVHPYSSVMDE